ncbi:N-acetyltransferase ESCO2 [Onthophagus taurus]|uniref:N-acetyltransferase ESCO2 n=1 Tax=Onthophagus taurus TaxID=166361 RepID=UPI0039BE8E8D
MASDQKNQIVPKYEHSDRMTFLRKALFPVDNEDNNSDLGPMSPLSDTSSEAPSITNCFASNRMEDYIMLDDSCDLEEENLDISTLTPSSMTPINFNSTCSDSQSPFYHSRLNKSPTKTLLTPQDTSTTNSKLPRLSRKSQSEDSDCENESKNDAKAPKARTALFIEINPLPAKSFYPKVEQRKASCNTLKVNEHKQVRKVNGNVKKSTLFLCNRKKRNVLGQINAGVGHKIKKPKVKATKISPKHVRMSLMEGKQLIAYMEDLKELKSGLPKQIKPLTQTLNNKENIEDKPKTIISQIIDDFNEEPEVPELNSILNLLDNDIKTQKIEEKPSNDRKRKHEQLIADMLLSPTSQMCDMASEMAINSPKRAKLNINNMLENKNDQLLKQRPITNVFNKVSSSSTAMMENNKKLFPIFTRKLGGTNLNENEGGNGSLKVNTMKKWDKIAPDQMLLDAGQKRFGVTKCPQCELVYCMGDINEEKAHMEVHNGTNVLKFKGWKNERVVFTDENSRIIKIISTDSKAWLKKAKEVLQIVNKEIGVDWETENDNKVIYFYIKNKTIIGCVLTIPSTKAYKLLSFEQDISYCSKESYVIKCGIQLFWVHETHRRHGIATTLLNTVRTTFLYGYILKLEDIGLYEVTQQQARAFVTKYFKTNNYLMCSE